MLWGIALLAIMAVTVGCWSDDYEIDSRVANFVESTSYTEEMLTGLKTLNIQGEWDLVSLYGEGIEDFGEHASLFFNDRHQVRVITAGNDKFILPTGVYPYSFDEQNYELKIENKVFRCYVGGTELYIGSLVNEHGFSLNFNRISSENNIVPVFFERRMSGRYFPRQDNHDAIVFPKLYVLNSREELAAFYEDKVEELPPIDFDRYTLLLGYVYLASRSTYPTEMDLREEDGKYYYTIHLTKDLKVAVTCDTWTYYFWRLYPKLHSNDVEVEITENIIND